MHRRLALMLAGLSLLAASPVAASPTPVTLTSADGVTVHGTWRPVPDPRAPVLLLFHQAEANRHEYDEIAPRLEAAGYATLAIDQRAGGSYFGGRNETTAGLQGAPPGFDAALPDLEAALAFGRRERPKAPVVAWGSSYSAALVFLLAAAHPGQLAALLAFSPGEYLAAPGEVRRAAAEVDRPVFVTSAQDAGEERAAAEILAAVPGRPKVQFLPRKGGVHGSATLVTSQNPAGAEAVWDAVLAFLKTNVPPPAPR